MKLYITGSPIGIIYRITRFHTMSDKFGCSICAAYFYLCAFIGANIVQTILNYNLINRNLEKKKKIQTRSNIHIR